jgi:uncharacterized secreted protein with C-terminal beta-propeller domain
MGKKIFAAVILVLFIGCSQAPQDITEKISIPVHGGTPLTKKEDMKTICIDGVTYFYFTESRGSKYSLFNVGFMSVKFNRDGTVSTCDETKPPAGKSKKRAQ